jgi:hypothetical protein
LKSGAKLFVITAMHVMVNLLTIQVNKPSEVDMNRTAFKARGALNRRARTQGPCDCGFPAARRLSGASEPRDSHLLVDRLGNDREESCDNPIARAFQHRDRQELLPTPQW